MKFTKKLKSIRAAGEYLNQDGILSEFLPKISNHISGGASSSIWRGDDENVPPPVNQINHKSAVLCGRKSSFGFRRPDLNSNTLFDPKLLEEFFKLASFCFTRTNDEENDIIVFPADKVDNALHPLMTIQEEEEEEEEEEDVNTLPPEESVVFYTTSLRGIRKTFDDCNMIRFLLDSFKVKYYERDISMHRQYREELRREREVIVVPPLLFIKGKCFGGAESVLCLHEQGKLRPLFEGIPIAGDKPCRLCNGMRFLICDKCRGSCRIVSSDDSSRIQCLSCNENGLIVCLLCSS